MEFASIAREIRNWERDIGYSVASWLGARFVIKRFRVQIILTATRLIGGDPEFNSPMS